MESDQPQLVLMRMDAEPPTQHTAQTAGGHGELLVLRIDDRLAWTRGEGVMVIAGKPGSRQFLQAVYVAPSGKFHMLRKTSGWRPFDARRDERYQVFFQARLRTAEGAWRATGTVVDISAGGAAIEIPGEAPQEHLIVDIAACGFRAELQVEVLSVSKSDACSILHCRFEALNAARNAFIRAVIAELEDRALASAA